MLSYLIIKKNYKLRQEEMLVQSYTYNASILKLEIKHFTLLAGEGRTLFILLKSCITKAKKIQYLEKRKSVLPIFFCATRFCRFFLLLGKKHVFLWYLIVQNLGRVCFTQHGSTNPPFPIELIGAQWCPQWADLIVCRDIFLYFYILRILLCVVFLPSSIRQIIKIGQTYIHIWHYFGPMYSQ